MKNITRPRKLIDSFNSAIEGFLYVVKSQRNMRIHFLLAVLTLILAIKLNFERIEIMVLCITAAMVLITEMINTAIEIVLNKISRTYSTWVRIVKDMSAGAVLVASLNAAIVGYFLFFRNNIFYQIFSRELSRISQSQWHVSFVILLILLGIVIIGKTLFHRGKPLRGGMPSGHSAIAFSVWALVALISKNALLIFTVFILSFMVAQSRISRHCHTFWEVFIGSFMGIVITVLIYRLLIG